MSSVRELTKVIAECLRDRYFNQRINILDFYDNETASVEIAIDNLLNEIEYYRLTLVEQGKAKRLTIGIH